MIDFLSDFIQNIKYISSKFMRERFLFFNQDDSIEDELVEWPSG